jgi:hypothetical protein
MGLVKSREVKDFPADPEYHVKTVRPNEQWKTDATYILVNPGFIQSPGGMTSAVTMR